MCRGKAWLVLTMTGVATMPGAAAENMARRAATESFIVTTLGLPMRFLFVGMPNQHRYP